MNVDWRVAQTKLMQLAPPKLSQEADVEAKVEGLALESRH